jgi:hypothetical protein
MERIRRAAVGAGRTARSAGLVICLGMLPALAAAGCGESLAAYTVAGHPSAVSHYKTFGVLTPDPEQLKENQMRPENMRRLADLTVERMKGLGYEPVALGDADLLIGLSPEARLYGPLEVDDDSAKVDQTLDESFDAEGTLNVNFVDRKAKHLVLKRVAKTRVNARLGDEQMRDIIAEVTKDLPRATL